MRELVIYEIHAGLVGGFEGVARALPGLAELGITAIELMPVGTFGGGRSWGYDGVLPFAPAEAYGSPGDLRHLVDTAHGLGIAVLMDVVYNHLGPDGNFLPRYASGFFDGRTEWGEAVAVERDEVACFFIENALMWLLDYRMDGLRFDAVHAIGNSRFLDAVASEARRAVPDRTIALILENENNDAERLDGVHDAQWNDDFHNSVHALLTGETDGYYGEFVLEPARKLARCLAEGFAFQGETFGNRGLRGTPSAHLPPTAFINFLQNHDQTGNRPLGERLVRLTGAARLKAATALTLLSPFPPLLFMGEEVGSEAPFLFFTDFDDDLAEIVRQGRRREFADHPSPAGAVIPDPNAPGTFELSRPIPGPNAEEWRDLYKRLLSLRSRFLVPHLDQARSLGAGVIGPAAVWARWQLGDSSEFVLAVNLGEAGISFCEAPDQPALFQTGDIRTGPGFMAWTVPP